MTKKRNLTTFMIAIMIMLFSLPANAEGTVGYAQWDVDSKTLTFKGGGSVPDGAFELNTGSKSPGWNSTTIKESVTKVVFDESFKDVRPTSCYQWFRLFSKLKTIEGIENLNTEEVTNMGDMFNSCKGLENLDLSSFNTAKVTDMGYMFSGSNGLTSLDLSSFNTAKVENMSCMFSSCYGLASLDLSSFNTAEVTDMRGMFGECSGLTSLDLSSFNTDKVTNMTKMFSDCSSLNKIYVSNYFATSEGISSDGMFYGCTNLIGNVPFDSKNIDHTMANYTSGYFTESNLTPCVKWNGDTKVLIFKVANYIKNTEGEGTAGECEFNEGAIALEGVDLKNNCKKVVFTPSFKQVTLTSCYSWFDSFSNLTTIQGIENLNTENVTNMMFMFYGCKKLTSLDLSSFYTAKVTNMNGMFGSCSSLTSLDLSSFDTDEVKDMSYMFGNCTGLKSLDLSSFNTDNVTGMGYMFGGCSGLTSLDVSKFNTANVTNMMNMFIGCSGLTSLDLSSFNTAKVTNMMNMFNGCKGLTSLDLSSFNTAKVEDMSYMFNGCSGLTTINVSDAFTTNKVSNSDGMFGGCYKLEGATSYNSGKTGKDMANFDGYFTPKTITPYVKWDANTKVLTFKVANNKEDGSGVYDLNKGANAPWWVCEVYSDCEKVVFTPSFKQAKPTSCCQWFLGFSKLTTIEGIENLNTEEVTDMSEMFNSCSGLKNLDLSSFNTAKVTNMGYMFGGCYDLISLDLSSFNTAKVTDMTWMFYNCQSLTTIYASDGFTTGEVSSSDGMFESCFTLEGATPWDITKTGIDMANFDGYFTPKNITPYVKWDASTKVLTFKVANTKEEGSGVYDLNEGENEPKWVREVYSDCEKVVFTPSFKHAKPTSCYLWFEGFEQLTTIEGIENLNTEEVTNMSGMFGGCSGLTSLDVSKFNTAEVENMSYMFYICSSLTSLDVSKFNTAKVTDMGNMFGGCSGLTSLDLSSFNTAKVGNMAYMFDGCKKLTSLDLSSFNTAKVTDMGGMFINCSGLTTIYVSDDFKIGNDTNGDNMFYNCSKLVGAVLYNSGNTDKDMANYNTGYFKTYFTLGDYKVELFGKQLTTDILNLSGDDDFVAHAPFTANEANYSRDLSSSGSTWFSLCLPFAYTPNNFTAYKLMSATDDAVEIGEISGEIVAGTPVLFKFKDGVVDVDKKIKISAPGANIVKAPVVDGSTAVNGPNGSSLQLYGTYQTKTFSSADGNAFILLNNKLMNPAKMLATTGVTKVGVKPFRAYMTLTASAPAQLASARAFSIGRGDEGNEGTTAIDLLNSVATDDAEYYDINGRRIDAPAKGVNIVRRGNKTIKLIIK